ncbi:NAD(P)H-hydrate dehydratase [Solicola sp. PLA-1-18]|uniref:NAD(P)H-hydrate dehydratase n=1 Tax=Solicola sp. PLA-1-18 TaxID=3380532 RepID=UPI003B808A4A
MLRAHRVDDVRAAEEALMRTVPEGQLMKRASRGLADHLLRLVEGDGAARVLVVVGPGNNGGDALFAGAVLAGLGVHVDVLPTDADRVHAEGLAAALAAGATQVDGPVPATVVVDGVVGIGGRGGLREPMASWWPRLQASGATVVAVDVPSGVDVDGGTLDGEHVTADLTVTFGTHKPAHLLDPAARASGPRPAPLVDIGLDPHLPAPLLEALEASDADVLDAAIGGATDPGAQKYTRGVVGVAAGSEQYAGAAQLCVRGAQAGVAGMVRFVGSAALCARIVDRCPEVVAHPDDGPHGRVQAWVVGPGGGDDVADRLALALADGAPLVVDADALAHVPDSFDVPALLTPHAGELARMLDVGRDEVEADPFAHVTRAAERWGVTVLLKGARTLVAHPGEPTRVNLTGSPWLATAGAGDVLAGLAGSFLAAGADPRTAGSLAAFLHGAASVRANPGGPITAHLVADHVPRVIAAMRRGELADHDVRDWRG